MTEVRSLTEAEPHLAGLSAVIFDLDDTLYSEKEYVRSGYRAVAALFPEVPDMAGRLWAAFLRGLPALDAVLGEEGLLDRKDEALHAYRFHSPEIRLYPGAAELLGRLRETKKLGIITDGRPEGQRSKIAALGLEDLADEIIVTDELGGTEYRKPNPAAFELMAERLGLPFGAMAYVGDNLKKDLIAPEGLGMRCVWVNNPDGLYYAPEGR